jgi:transcriptional regulator with XRE-family HTH domain
MNEICKTRILEKFRELSKETKLKNAEVAEKLGIHVCNINWANSEKTVDRISKPVLLKLRDIVNSGESLDDYFKKNGQPVTKPAFENTKTKEPVKPIIKVEAKPEIKINKEAKVVDFIINISLRINGKEVKI